MTAESSIVSEVRQRAMKISRRYGHDLHKYCAHLRQQEKRHPGRVVDQITVVPSANSPRRQPASG